MPKASSTRSESRAASTRRAASTKDATLTDKQSKSKDKAIKSKDKEAKSDTARGQRTRSRAAVAEPPTVWSPEAVPSLPHMEPEGIALLGEHLTGTQVFLEYGAGGSSVMVAQAGVKSVYSVDTDKRFLKAVKQRLRDEGIPRRRYIPIYADIGATKEWGRPTDESHARDWPDYCAAPWKKLLKTGERPDLVLIDGRFRVASFLITMLMAPPGCVILFDDYVNRPEYHIVERYLQPVRLAGRMAEFVVEPVAEPYAAIIDLLHYSTESR